MNDNKLTRAGRRVVEVAAEARNAYQLRKDVAQLRQDIEESRRLNERLSDVLDVVVELLLPEADRNDERLQQALKKL